jgi:hypothetical protein
MIEIRRDAQLIGAARWMAEQVIPGNKAFIRTVLFAAGLLVTMSWGMMSGALTHLPGERYARAGSR